MYAIKVELKLNNSEKTLMNKHLGFSRFCYNYALSIYSQLDHKQYPGGSSKKIDLIKKIFTNVTKKNPDFAWTKQLSSRVYQNAFRNLKTAFSRYFQGLGKYPKYKKKKNSSSFTVDSSNGVITQSASRIRQPSAGGLPKAIGDKHIKLPTLGIFRIFEAIPPCVAQTYTVSRQGDRYYVAFAINAELTPPIQHEVFKPVGIDVNLTDGKYCVLSDGTFINFPKPLKAAITKLSKFQYRNRSKQLGNRRTGEKASNNARKYYLKLSKLHKRVADARTDFLQKLTTDLARKYRHLKLETLNLQGMMANKKLAFHLADASFYKLKTLLENKAKVHGGIIESVSQWYPSSKLCSQCQRKKKNIQLSDRIYDCDSPFCRPLCRDLNSSINLENAPPEQIISRVGSTRSNACGHSSADTYGSKQEKNAMGRQFLLPLSK